MRKRLYSIWVMLCLVSCWEERMVAALKLVGHWAFIAGTVSATMTANGLMLAYMFPDGLCASGPYCTDYHRRFSSPPARNPYPMVYQLVAKGYGCASAKHSLGIAGLIGTIAYIKDVPSWKLAASTAVAGAALSGAGWYYACKVARTRSTAQERIDGNVCDIPRFRWELEAIRGWELGCWVAVAPVIGLWGTWLWKWGGPPRL